MNKLVNRSNYYRQKKLQHIFAMADAAWSQSQIQAAWIVQINRAFHSRICGIC